MSAALGYSRVKTPPVLLIVFNRPEPTRRVMRALERVRPEVLYVAADGPRGTEDAPACAAARRVATTPSWDCQVRTLFRDENLGCRHAVTGAIDWLFTHEDVGIILEDDCVPDPTFFPYATELLERYRADDRVMSITGDGYHPGPLTTSYSFTRHQFIWGWATWRQSWHMNDPHMRGWEQLRTTDWLRDVGDGHEDFVRYWTDRFDEAAAGVVDSWAYPWLYSCWRQGGVSAIPDRLLVENIGFDETATHTRDADWRSGLRRQAMNFPLVHPETVSRDRTLDRWADIHVFYTRRLMWRARAERVPGGLSALRAIRGAKNALRRAGA